MAQQKIEGIDVTVECLVTPNLEAGLIGLSLMAWHINHVDWNKSDEFSENDYLEIPASLFCGGVDHSYRSLLFGTSMHGEPLSNDELHQYMALFCTKTLPWQYLNHFDRIGIARQGSMVQVEYINDLIVRANLEKMTNVIIQGPLVLRDEDNVFVPAV